MRDNEHEKRPVWRPTPEYPMPTMYDQEGGPLPVAAWVGRLGQLISLTLLVMFVALAAAPLVWALRRAWGWALG